jgi:hypothetical protein
MTWVGLVRARRDVSEYYGSTAMDAVGQVQVHDNRRYEAVHQAIQLPKAFQLLNSVLPEKSVRSPDPHLTQITLFTYRNK